MKEDHRQGRLIPHAIYVVYATRINGDKVIVSESQTKVDMLWLKGILVWKSEEFDDTARLTQYRVG